MTRNVLQIRDGHGRRASYMRISVTDRCNLRCRYCMPREAEFIPHDKILSYEEIEQLIALSSDLGITKVRLTGGEPFVRRGFTDFLKRVHGNNPGLDLRVTTNGTLLRPLLDEVAAAGVQVLNISLDTLYPGRFQALTGLDAHAEVVGAIDGALAHGLRVKVNVVGLRGVNDDELGSFIRFASERPVDVRFIEFMPMGGCVAWSPEKLWPAEDIIEEAGHHADLEAVARSEGDQGPVRLFRLAGGLGRIGVISPMSNHFCGSCNRLRITSTGKLRTCLYSDREYRLRPILAHPRLSIEAVKQVILRAGRHKPLGYDILNHRLGGAVCSTHMSAIGG
ncbi:MAG: GTP 3',8-cyclase MoaA [Proteobacteria bacterium]|nr:GTP 3',8-cyclase MoaA [Pseudomonadota bacterium]